MGRNQCSPHLQKAGLGLRENKNLDKVAHPDCRYEQQHYRLDSAHPKPLQGQEKQHVQARDDHRPEQRDVEQ